MYCTPELPPTTYRFWPSAEATPRTLVVLKAEPRLVEVFTEPSAPITPTTRTTVAASDATTLVVPGVAP